MDHYSGLASTSICGTPSASQSNSVAADYDQRTLGYTQVASASCATRSEDGTRYSGMANNQSEVLYKSKTIPASHGILFQEQVALAMILQMRDNPNFQLGYEVKAAGKFDDILLYDDKNDVIHFIQAKHGYVTEGEAMQIDNEAFFPQQQGKGDFELSMYAESYEIVGKEIQKEFPHFGTQYKKKFYILTNRKLNPTIQVKSTANFQEVDDKSLPFFKSGGQCFKLTENTIEDLTKRVNKSFNEVKNAIKEMFDTSEISEISDTLKNYCTPLKAVLEIDKNNQCSFLKSFITNSEKSGNNYLYNMLKEEGYDMTQKVKVGMNFLQKDSRSKNLPPHISKQVVKEFVNDFSLLLGQPHDVRTVIDSELKKWLKTWVRPDVLGKISPSDMDRMYNSLKRWFDPLIERRPSNERAILKTGQIQKCLEDIRKDEKELEAEDAEELSKFYINRRIIYRKKYETSREFQTVDRQIDDKQFVEEIGSSFKGQQCFVLAADPGMGKSSLLKFLAFEAQKKYEFDVFLVYFNDLIKALDEVDKITAFDEVIRVLQVALSRESCDIIRKAPDQRVGQGFSILLVLDGFDEIHQMYTDKVISMLNVIRQKQSIQMFISSRMHTQKLLEEKFGVQSMLLQPFSEDDQISYMKKRWNVLNDTQLEKLLRIYSKELLKQLQFSIPSSESSTFGSPLLLRMLAENHRQKFEQYIRPLIYEQEQHFDVSADKLNVVKLYEDSIRLFFRLELEEKSGGHFSDADLDRLIVVYNLEHQLLAMTQLRIDIGKKIFEVRANVKTYEDFVNRCVQKSEKSRLVKVVENEVQFCHLSYGEYFVAKYLFGDLRALGARQVLDALADHDVIRKFFLIMLDGCEEYFAFLKDMCKDGNFAIDACRNGCLNIIKFLLESDSSSKIKKAVDRRGMNVLHAAAENGHYHVVQGLIEAGVDVNSLTKTCTKLTALHLAAYYGYDDIVKLLLHRRANKAAKAAAGYTALHYAVKGGNDQVIQTLIDNGLDVESRTDEGMTPLRIAVAFRRVEALNLLISNKVNVNALVYDVPNPKLQNCRTALHDAAVGGDVQIINILIDAGANPNSRTNYDATPLHFSAHNGHVDASERFIDRGTDVNAVDARKSTALHWAVEEGRVSVVQLLLDKSARVDIHDEDGCTVLHLASRRRHAQVIRSLIVARANPKARTKEGSTPLHEAVKECREDAVALLIPKSEINATDKENRTALYLANRLDSRRFNTKQKETLIDMLVKAGATENV